MLCYFVLQQAITVPSNDHSLYHKYHIDAVTLKGIPTTSVRADNDIVTNLVHLGKSLEAILHSLNNLLDLLHQSFFFLSIAFP